MQLVKKRCYKCGGTGSITCRRCNGKSYYTGQQIVQWGDYIPKDAATYTIKTACNDCHCTGIEECPRCKGRGEIMLNSSEEIGERKKYDCYKLYKRFDIDPMNIDRDIFKKVRGTSENSEWVRQTILDAFEEMDNNPKKYAKPFKTMNMVYEDYSKPIDYNKPREEREEEKKKTIEELIAIANVLADMADWVHLSLEWAHIIANNINAFKIETGRDGWDYVCRDDEKINNLRPLITSLVIWKNGYVRYSAATNFVPGIISGGDRPFTEKITFCDNLRDTGMLVVK